MFSRISTLRVLSVLLIIMFMLAGVGPFYATPATAQAAEALSLLQFTSGGHVLRFTPQGVYAATGSHALRVDFVDANLIQPQADASANNQSESLGRVTYSDLWEGISLEYSASTDSIYTTTYSLSPGADANNIHLRYNAPLTLNQNGTLNIAFKTGTLTESAPIAWQNISDQRVSVDISFHVRGQEVSFTLGKYDPRHALTIDPSLTWNTFLGGSGEDWGRAITVDGSGNIYIAGNSYATWGSPPVRVHGGNRDGFAAKLSPNGALIWNTFLGGSGLDAANGIALDGSGNVYVVGDSSTAWSCLDVLFGCTVTVHHGGVDAFAAKLNSSGHLDWNTFIGEGYTDYGTAIAVNTISNPNVVWVASDDGLWNGIFLDFNVIVTKLDLSGSTISDRLLGVLGDAYGLNDYVNAITVDGSGNVYVVGDSDTDWGGTWSLPVHAHQGGVDAFAAKLDSSANLLWHTFLGGSGMDHGYGIAVDGSRNVYVAGESNATWGSPPVHDYQGGVDAFAAKLNSSGSLIWNTFLGEGGNDSGHGIAVNGSGNVYVTGYIYTLGNPLSVPAAPINPTNDAFATQLSSSGTLMANTFLGGSDGQDYGNSIAVRGGNVYLAGDSTSTWGGSPVRPFTTLGGRDAFVAKVVFTQSTVFRSVGTNDGWVLESTETSNVGGTMNNASITFILGDNAAKKQYRGVLSFNTGAGLPDNAVLTKVTLKVKKQGITGGGNPITAFQGFMADIKKGFFGTTALQTSDFQVAASHTYGPFTPALSVGWYSLNLTSAKAYINKLASSSGLTQIRLRFKLDDNNNGLANYLSLYCGNAGAASSPQLIVEYYVP